MDHVGNVYFVVIVVASFYILKSLPFLFPEYWQADPAKLFSNPYGGVSIGSRLMYFLIPLIWIAIAYAQFFATFTLINKLRKFTPKPYISKQGCFRAAQLTKWSFILILMSMILIMLFFQYWADENTEIIFLFNISEYFGAIKKLSFAGFVYTIELLIAIIIMYAFIQGHLPIYMRRVQPKKIYLSFGLISICMSAIGFVFGLGLEWLVRFIMNTVMQPRSSVAFFTIILCALFVASLWMCKKILLENIQIALFRFLVALIMIIPSLWFTMEIKKLGISFFHVFPIVFFLMTSFLFILSYSIKWALGHVYGKIVVPE